MKKNRKNLLKSILGLSILLGVSASAITPIIFSSVGFQNIFGRQIASDLLVLQLSATNIATTLNDFTISQVNINQALYGSTSINNGNYMIGYMSLSNIQGTTNVFDFTSTSTNWDWLQSLRTGSGSPLITKDTKQIFVNNNFIKEFFNLDNGLSDVANFYLIVDLNPNLDAQIEMDTEHVPQRFANPSSVWTQDLILKQFNYFHPNNPANPTTGSRPNAYGSLPFIDLFEDLPEAELAKENKFIRTDSSAVAYRNLTAFVSRWKPQLFGMTGTSNDLSGFVAYTQTKTADSTNPDHVPTIKPALSIAIPKDQGQIVLDQLKDYYLNEI